MDIDVCYVVDEREAYKYIRKYVNSANVPLAIYSATDDLYINKKTMWNTYESLSRNGVLAVQTELRNLGIVLNAAKNICNDNENFDILIFHNEDIPGKRLQCFYDACIVFVILYRYNKPVVWSLPDPANLYGGRPNVIRCTPDIDINRKVIIPELSHDMISKLLEVTNFQDVVLLVGNKSLYYAKSIKSLCRHVIGFGGNAFSEIENEGVRLEVL